jgi:hypothetical protein
VPSTVTIRTRIYLPALPPTCAFEQPASDLPSAASIRNAVVSSWAHMSSIRGRSAFTVDQPTSLTAAFDQCWCIPSNRRTFARPSKSLHLQPPSTQTDTRLHRLGRRVLRLCSLPSRRLRTRKLTPICQIRGDELMMLALTNWCITSVVKLHLRKSPFLHPSQAQAASSFGTSGLPRNGTAATSREAESLVNLPCSTLAPLCYMSHWNYIIKPCGTRKARMCCDGPKRQAQSFASPKVCRASSRKPPLRLSAASGFRRCRLH